MKLLALVVIVVGFVVPMLFLIIAQAKSERDVAVIYYSILTDFLNITDVEKAKALYGIKQICLETDSEKPSWWYSERNKLDWIDEEGNFLLKYDLGGF